MYGYITPDKPNLYFKDFALYRAFYCGTCKRIAKLYGTSARMTTNYDITFLEVLLFSYLGVRPEFRRAGCILNPFKKKDYVKATELLDTVIAFNALLSYYNVDDDVNDGEGLKKMIPKSLLKKSRRRASKALPECDRIIRARYADLRALEKNGCDSADRAADPFGRMMKECVEAIVGEKFTADLGDFCYNLARYIYLIDALDDLGKDAKKKQYNPYLAAYGDYSDRESFLTAHRREIEGGIRGSVTRCKTTFAAMVLTEANDLLSNIVYRGLDRKLNMVLGGVKGAAKEKI